MTEPARKLDDETGDSIVYFVRSTSFMKIGHTREGLRERLRSLQTGNPHRLEVVATMPGGPTDERHLHTSLSTFRVRGEWFDAEIVECALELADDKTAEAVARAAGELLSLALLLLWAQEVPARRRARYRRHHRERLDRERQARLPAIFALIRGVS